MENPEEEISGVIYSLTQGTRAEQERTLNHYFLPNAYFVHPYCRVPSFESSMIRIPLTNMKWTINSRWFISIIYRWYKIMSPKISLEVDSTSFDSRTDSLYATIRQTFTIWIVPFNLWQANVRLVCLLKLARLPVNGDQQPLFHHKSTQSDQDQGTAVPPKRYFICGQEDHYQINDALEFIFPLGASALYYVWQLVATLFCAVGVALLWPVTLIHEQKLSDLTRN